MRPRLARNASSMSSAGRDPDILDVDDAMVFVEIAFAAASAIIKAFCSCRRSCRVISGTVSTTYVGRQCSRLPVQPSTSQRSQPDICKLLKCEARPVLVSSHIAHRIESPPPGTISPEFDNQRQESL